MLLSEHLLKHYLMARCFLGDLGIDGWETDQRLWYKEGSPYSCNRCKSAVLHKIIPLNWNRCFQNDCQWYIIHMCYFFILGTTSSDLKGLHVNLKKKIIIIYFWPHLRSEFDKVIRFPACIGPGHFVKLTYSPFKGSASQLNKLVWKDSSHI